MNAGNLITEHLDIWTTAEKPKKTGGRGRSKKANGKELYGIKKLRELILDLAVRGKLVEQNSEDESASVLLEKIAAEKARLLKDGKIKKQKKLPEITEEEKPFGLPDGWEWVRLGTISQIKGGKRLPKGHSFSSVETPFIYIQVTNMKNGTIIRENIKYISEETKSIISQYTISKNDLYITIAGTIGDIGDVPEYFDEMNLTENAAKILFLKVDKFWLKKTLSSQAIQRQFIEKTNQLAQPKLALHRISSSCLALPPLAEQHRIVAKVDELMTLCGQLEEKKTAGNATRRILLQTLLAVLVAGADQDQKVFSTAWEHIATHFDLLFSTEQAIDQLKQTILQLAVMGKLVPQNPKDEPAATLLNKIAREKARLLKDGKIKKQKKLPEITEEEKPFELPDGWELTRLDDTALKSEAGWSPKCKGTPREGEKWGVLKVSAVTWGTYKHHENKELPEHLSPRRQYEVRPGDFLISRANTANLVARAVIVPDKAPRHLMMSDKIIRFTFFSSVNIYFINLVNSSPYSRSYYARVAGGTSDSMKNVSRNKIRALTIPIPPLAEQHRIVAKVDELMALCDQLKSRLHENQTTKLQLADTIVNLNGGSHAG